MKLTKLILLPAIFIAGSVFSQNMQCDTILLDGKVTRKQLEKYSWFKPTYNKYQPDEKMLTELAPLMKGITVTCVMGSWCSDSKEHVPAFMKIADAVKLPAGKLKIIAVNKKKTTRKADIKKLSIESVPTFIIYRRNKSIGRIVETPVETLEKDLLKILKPTQ